MYLPPFKGDINSPQFTRWLEEVQRKVQQPPVTVSADATNLATALTLLNEIKAVFVAKGTLI